MSALRAKDFTPGVPVALMLRATEPRQAPDNGFGPAMVFSSTAGPIYLDPDAAREIVDQVHQLAIRPNELIRIAKIKTTHGGHRWHVERPDPSRNVSPSLCGDGAQDAAASDHAGPVITPRSAKMCAAMCSAVDAILEVQAYAARRGLGVTFSEESVRAIGLTIYIGEDRR